MFFRSSPCSGKSRYVREHAGDQDVIYDYDALLYALTNRTEHLTAKHAAHPLIVDLRRVLVDLAMADVKRQITTFWMICSWPNSYTLSAIRGLKHEKIYIQASREECLDRLMKDQTRPDKDAWTAVINDWFQQYGHYPERWAESEVRIIR